MSKLHIGFGAALSLLFCMMVFSLFIGPVLANSNQATFIGGATNGNIFGSIQYDELNVTDTGVWRFDTGGGPIIATFTYNAVNPTLIYNSSIIITLPLTLFGAAADGQGNTFNNIGAAGNDFGATNTLVSTSMADNDITDIGTLSGGTISTKLVIETERNNANQGNAFEIFTLTAVDAQQGRLSFTGGFNIATATVTLTTWDFGSNSVLNVGAAGNDFGATNTLVSSFFTGNVNATGFVRANEYYSGDNTQGMTGACAPATTLTIKDGLVTACA